MTRPYQSKFSRATCKGCSGPNDREHDGNLGGLFCRACIAKQRRDHWRAKRAKIVQAFRDAGKPLCTLCYRRESTVKSRCETCASRLAARSTSTTAKHRPSLRDANKGCARCHLRGPHECLPDRAEARRSSWANMEGR